MENVVIIAVLAVLFIVGAASCVKHFKGQGGCCGGGGNYRPRKKLSSVIAQRTLVIEGMMCENCEARVERYLNDIEGAAAKVSHKKGTAVVSMDRELADDVLRAAVKKAGYTVTQIR